MTIWLVIAGVLLFDVAFVVALWLAAIRRERAQRIIDRVMEG